jgi:nucleotide-binding universal stress UspA family protein
MSRIPLIVAPVDFTDSSTQALTDAAAWASELGSELHLLHVVPDPTAQALSVEAFGVDFNAIAEEWMANAQRNLDALVTKLPIPTDRVKTRVQMGSRPGEHIVSYAKQHGAGMIIMASGEHGRVARFLLGSVADYVVRAASCPVLIVPTHAHDAAEISPAAGEVSVVTAARR